MYFFVFRQLSYFMYINYAIYFYCYLNIYISINAEISAYKISVKLKDAIHYVCEVAFLY